MGDSDPLEGLGIIPGGSVVWNEGGMYLDNPVAIFINKKEDVGTL